MKNSFIIFLVIAAASTDRNIYESALVRLIEDAGHKVEVHKVLTEDNYILTVFRLPTKLENPKIIFIMHGLESSTADFVIGGNGASLAYLMADNGYDVWLGNARGNIFSQAHKTLNTDSHDFWKFSFHEIGVYDLPAIIDYALRIANATSLTYCGHSQGTTAFFVLLSMRPSYNAKISTAHLLTPVAFMRFPHPYAKLMAQMFNQIEDLFPKVFQFTPASSGYRQLMHYIQIINAGGNFIRFDHQKQKNFELFGHPAPPAYNLSNVQTKIHFLYGTNDLLANQKDVQFLAAKLKKTTIGITKLNDFNHLDFVYGKDIQKKVNNVILQKIKSRE